MFHLVIHTKHVTTQDLYPNVGPISIIQRSDYYRYLKSLEYLHPGPWSPVWSRARTFITFSVDTGDVPSSRSGAAGTFGCDASFLLPDLPQVAGRMVAGDGLEQVRAASLQGGVGLPQHVSPPLSETWQWQGQTYSDELLLLFFFLFDIAVRRLEDKRDKREEKKPHSNELLLCPQKSTFKNKIRKWLN